MKRSVQVSSAPPEDEVYAAEAEVVRLRRQVAFLQEELGNLKRSWTWRVGRLLVAPPALLKRALGSLVSTFYPLGYLSAFIRYHLSVGLVRGGPRDVEYDLCFVLFEKSKGWVLEAICREIAAHLPGKVCYHHLSHSLPPARAYFFAHYAFLPICLKRNPGIWGSKILVLFTHPRDLRIGRRELVLALNLSTRVICLSSEFARWLVNIGVGRKKTTFVVGGADPEVFKPHQRSDGAVGFCSAYYRRKSPELIIEIVQRMPHRRFILLGRNWRDHEGFSDLVAAPNFSYIEVPYSEYPKHYAVMDVFVSPARLEGGPIPLIEAMMCNVVPVASRTGFAPDVIQSGQNGFLFEVGSPAAVVCDLIEKAYQLKTDIRKTVEHLSWRNFSLEIQKHLGEGVPESSNSRP